MQTRACCRFHFIPQSMVLTYLLQKRCSELMSLALCWGWDPLWLEEGL